MGVVVAVIGGVVIQRGITVLKRADLTPSEAVRALKEDTHLPRDAAWPMGYPGANGLRPHSLDAAYLLSGFEQFARIDAVLTNNGYS